MNHRGRDRDEAVVLARRLVDRVLATPSVAPGARDEHGRQVFLDVNVDGVRCLLVEERSEPQPEHSLSPREREIVRMVAEGYPNKTIAAVLEISSWTVSTYLRRIFAKLGVRSRAAMVARAFEEGLATEPELHPTPNLRPRAPYG